MQKIKTLKPSMRIKKRYIEFEILSDTEIELKEISNAFNSKVKEFIGTYGFEMSGFQILKESTNKKIIAKTNTKYLDLIKHCASLVKEAAKTKITIHSVKTSGVIKKIIGDK